MARFRINYLLSIGSLALLATTSSANVLLQGFYWDVPSPAAGNAGAPWWWDNLSTKANALAKSGFTGIWIPPVLKSASGGYSDGYDPFDDYDIGSKNQKGTIPTRYGTREQLEKACATLRANGMEIYLDIVDNHRDGDSGNWAYGYVNAYGVANQGRFGKSFYDFHPNVTQDPNVPDGAGENFNAFGRDLAPINGPSHWIYNGLINAGDWVTKALDLQGYRLDNVKGISTDWLSPFLNSQSMAGKFAVGEFYDYNLGTVQGWVNSMSGRASAFDFPLRGALKAMCNTPGTFNMATLDHAGLTGQDPFHAVTFVENHDTDRSEPIVANKMLAYAYILTSEGYPSVFYKDYSTDAGNYGLKPGIDNLIWIHEKLASGTTAQRWKNNLVFVYERQGGSKLLVGLNNNIGYNYNLYGVQTGFGPNVTLHDYTGHAADIVTDGSGKVNMSLPPAINGAGYCAYAPAGITGIFNPIAQATTQEYAGADDLDIKPADNTQFVQVARIYSEALKPINASLYFDTTGWTANTSITLQLCDAAGNLLKTGTYTSATAQGTALTYTPSFKTWYVFKIRSTNTPGANPRPKYWLRTTYQAPQTSVLALRRP